MSEEPVRDGGQLGTATGALDQRIWRVLQNRAGVDQAAAEAITAGLRRAEHRSGALSVYLDLNHWISLAKARVGHPDGIQFAPCLDLLSRAAADDIAVFPLCESHYLEVGNIAAICQRADVANVMAVLSGFTALASRKERLRYEVAAVLHDRLGRPAFPARLAPIGRGMAFAFGIGNGPAGRLQWPVEVPPQMSAAALAELEFRLNQVAEYLVLRGPRPEDMPAMPGYGRRAVQAIAEARASREQEVFELLQTDAGAVSRLGDVVHARGLYWELGPMLPELLALAGISMDSFFWRGKEWLTSLLDGVPAIAVRTALVMQTDKNGSRAWTRNDIYDIDALEAAVPYCDVVVTERYACDVMNRSGLAGRFGTTVIRRLRDLAPIVQAAVDDDSG